MANLIHNFYIVKEWGAQHFTLGHSKFSFNNPFSRISS